MTQGVQAIRNVSFVGHPGSGKTTLVDALAHLLGASQRKGSVADGTSICDTEPEEHERKSTLQVAVVHAEGVGCTWNLLDTPGYPDFIAEAEGAMFASDLVIAVVSCTSGITFNLRQKFNKAAELGRARAIVLTHLDAENANFDATVRALRAEFTNHCVPAFIPDADGPAFSAVHPSVDDPEVEWRRRFMDRVMDSCEDEALLMEYLESQELTREQLDLHTPNAIARGSVIPILVCNPQSGLGVKEVLEWLAEFAPSPLLTRIVSAEGEPIRPVTDGPPVGTVFNVKTDPHVGKVCLARLWRGTLDSHEALVGEAGGKGEKPGSVFHLVGKKREALEKAFAGDIVAFSKVDHIHHGMSFTSAGHDVVSVPMPAPPVPSMAVAVTPKTRSDEQKIGEALHKLVAEDPTLQLVHDSLTHELVVHGMSDLHLQIMESRLKRRFNVEISTSLPRISYRETITRPVEAHYRHKKQTGGRGQFGECYLRLKPLERGAGVQFTDGVVGGAIPRNLIPAVEKGVREQCAQGVLTHGTVVDVEIEVYDGKFHAVDSDEASFKMAGSRAFREGFAKAGPVLLEPVMELEIHAPTDVAGTIFSDITSQRRGHVLDQWNEADGQITVVKARVPLSTVQTYHRDLKSQTAGEGYFRMVFADYAPVPANEQAKVLAEYGRKRAADED